MATPCLRARPIGALCAAGIAHTLATGWVAAKPQLPAECIYAPFAARGFAREFVKDLEVGTHCCGIACSLHAHGSCWTALRLPRQLAWRLIPGPQKLPAETCLPHIVLAFH